MTFIAISAHVGKAYDRIREHAAAWKSDADRDAPLMAAGAFDSQQLLNLLRSCRGKRDAMNVQISSVPNLSLIEEAKRVENDPAYDAALEFITMRDSMNDFINEIDNNWDWSDAFDTDAGGDVPKIYTPAELNTVRTLAEASSATIS